MDSQIGMTATPEEKTESDEHMYVTLDGVNVGVTQQTSHHEQPANRGWKIAFSVTLIILIIVLSAATIGLPIYFQTPGERNYRAFGFVSTNSTPSVFAQQLITVSMRQCERFCSTYNCQGFAVQEIADSKLRCVLSHNSAHLTPGKWTIYTECDPGLSVGGSLGTHFSDESVYHHGPITKVFIRAGWFADAFLLTYGSREGFGDVCDGLGNYNQTIDLGEGETIEEVFGTWGFSDSGSILLNVDLITQIGFKTNFGREFGPYGEMIGDHGFRFGDPGSYLKYVSGKKEKSLRELTFFFECP